jgi:hypothetical protein
VGRRLSISVGKYGTDFQAEIYAILAHASEIQMKLRHPGSSESSSSHQNNAPIGTTVPKGIE